MDRRGFFKTLLTGVAGLVGAQLIPKAEPFQTMDGVTKHLKPDGSSDPYTAFVWMRFPGGQTYQAHGNARSLNLCAGTGELFEEIDGPFVPNRSPTTLSLEMDLLDTGKWYLS